jgi:hypothetical protein
VHSSICLVNRAVVSGHRCAVESQPAAAYVIQYQ